MIRTCVLACILVALPGCAAIGIGVDALVGGVGIYQRYADRQVQLDQTHAIRELRDEISGTREEIRRLREALTE
jgi:hypothetical protein